MIKTPVNFVRKDVLDLVPYMPSKEVCSIKLDANECPYDVPDNVKERIWKRLNDEHFNFYCDPNCDELREKLSEYTGLSHEQIFIGSGADEIINDIIMAFAGPKRDVIIPSPTFSSYEIYSTISGSNVIKVPIKKIYIDGKIKWDLDIEQIEQHFDEKNPQLLFICHPNNPTGDYFDESKILYLIKNFNGIVAVDEAYYEFGGKTFADKLAEYPHVIIIRTFSKIFSLAGLRVGYALGDKDVIKQLYRVKLPYNVSLFSQIAAVEVLKELDWVKEIREKLIAQRKLLWKGLNGIKGLTPSSSSTNFFLCEFEIPRDLVYEKLLKKGILTRRFDDEVLKNTLRFSIGTGEQNKILLNSLKEIIDNNDF